MCGIVGAASTRELGNVDRAAMMRDAMIHRGPDDAGLWVAADRRVWLGMRRLAIIDVSPSGHQPMCDPSGRVCLVFNGEIYNYKELRAQLSAGGYRFRSKSDTEVLLKAYQEWGTNCLEHLNGMFAFAMYDATRRRLFVARDRAGEKPLFYWHDGRQLVFASELKALLADPMCPRRVDLHALNHYLAYGYVPRDLCMVAGLTKLEPAAALVFDLDRGTLRTWRYWRLPPPYECRDESFEGTQASELEDELESLLRDSVRLRLQADVPVAVMLSGGTDSSVITAMAAAASSKPVRTFTICFPGHGAFDEGPHARAVAKHFGTDHTELTAEPETLALLPELARQVDEPMADSSIIPTFLVSRLVREHATVALGGDGGDELFGGYLHYSWLERQARLRRVVPRPIRVAASRVAEAVVPLGTTGRNYAIGLSANDASSPAYVNMFFDAKARCRLIRALGALPVGERIAPERLRATADGNRPGLVDHACAVDFATFLPDDILVKVDRASMLTSLEVRSPWLDRRVIEFAFGRVPAALRATTKEQKVLARRLARRLLPKTVDVDRKQGFSIPLETWIRDGRAREIEDTLREGPEDLFDRRAVDRLLASEHRGRRNGQRLFALAVFELWRRCYGVSAP